jgi:phage gp29-like protein
MDFIFLGQASVGSFALSSDKTALFAQALGSYVRRMADVLNRQVLAPIWELNALDPALMPKFEPTDLEKPDLGELSAFISTMAGAGAQLFVSQDDQNWARKIAGMPPAPEEGLGDQGVPVEPTPKPKGNSGGAAEPVKKSAAEISAEIDEWILAREEAEAA